MIFLQAWKKLDTWKQWILVGALFFSLGIAVKDDWTFSQKFFAWGAMFFIPGFIRMWRDLKISLALPEEAKETEKQK